MKTILLGNAGAGKSTLAKRVIASEFAERLSLDEIAFSEQAVRRPIEASVSDAKAFIESHDSWIIEGCYSNILEPLLPLADTLLFLNPGVETCVEHCKRRPWEPEKFESADDQNANLENLIEWVRQYPSREDEYGLKRHRQLFNAFEGEKFEYKNSAEYRAI